MKDNKLIAEFMGYQILHKTYDVRSWNSSNEYYWAEQEGDIVCDNKGHEVDDYNNEPYVDLEDLPFLESWDWLMPVVAKIRSNPLFEESHTVVFDEDGIYAPCKADEIIIAGLYTQNIERVYKGVVEFIEWYNNK